jgi:Asp-tRNA(Asn)/Glu-tRNA(Gln) amidotransferase C subunit
LSKQSKSDGNLDQVAKELSVILDHQDVLNAADVFDALAASIRKMPHRKTS